MLDLSLEAVTPPSTAPSASGWMVDEITVGLDTSDTLDAICRYALLPPGKMFRPWLLLESCAAAGGDPWTAIPAAVGTEFGHVASLVHDDIIDRDDQRRGRASVPHEFGTDNAIVAGDALLFGLFQRLAQCRDRGIGAERIVAALAAVSQAGIDLCRGQLNETFLCNNPEAAYSDYLAVIRGKTSALFAGACEVGSLLGGGSPETVAALRTYGDALGVTFQMADDLLPYRSQSDLAGKDLLSDVRNRRMTLPLIVAAELGGPEVRAALADLFAAVDDLDDEEMLGGARRLIDDTGALEQSDRRVDDYAEQAREALQQLPESESRARLTAKVSAAAHRAA